MPLLLIILLLTPFIDIILAFSWLFKSPLAAGAYLIGDMVVGALLMKIGKIGVRETMATLRDGHGFSGLLSGFAAVWLGGALLFFPGYLSDGVAVLLLLLSYFSKGQSVGMVGGIYHSQTSSAESTESEPSLQAEGTIIDNESPINENESSTKTEKVGGALPNKNGDKYSDKNGSENGDKINSKINNKIDDNKQDE